MNPQMAKLLDYEKKILESRNELQELMRQHELYDDEAMKHKLNHFQNELLYMEQQLAFLKADVERQSSTPHVEDEKCRDRITQVELPVEKKTEERPGEPVKEVAKEPSRQQRQAYVETNSQIQVKSEKRATSTKASKDLEKTIGKSLMGIVASVLIFISFILFATLLLPYFNDTAKMLTTYIISFVFLGTGLWKLKKDKENKFYLALTGCGFGALYISLLLSNMYFRVIGDITLYVLICIWAIGVCFLGKHKSILFQIIGQLGIWISMIFGCSLCEATGDIAKFAALILFYIISSSIFYLVHYNREFSKNMIHHVSHALNFLILLLGCNEVVGEGVHVITILVLMLLISHIGACFYSSCQNSNLSFGIFLGIYAFVTLQVLNLLFTNDDIYAIVAYGIAMGLMTGTLLKNTKGNAGKNTALIVLSSMALICLGINESWMEHGMVPLLILPFLVLGFWKANGVLKYYSLFLFFIYACAGDVTCLEHFLLGSLVVVGALCLLYHFKEQYSPCLKGWLHALTVFFLYGAIKDLVYDWTYSHDGAGVCAYLVVVLFQIIMMKSPFGKNLKTGEPEKTTLYNIVNALFMINGLVLLNSGLEGVWHFLAIITAIITFMVNAKILLEERNQMVGGIYVGLKFTILLVVILDSFEAANYVISIACFVFAIINIVIGFTKEYKSLRVFGLILSMISTFKLIMIDIYYSNTLGNALSFFASGILCFAISLIYNQIDKKMKEERQEQAEGLTDIMADKISDSE